MHPAIARDPVRALAASRIREVANAAMGAPDMPAFWFGEPDRPPPGFIVEAAKRALDAGDTFYLPNLGLPELREALAGYASRLHAGADPAIGAGRIAVTSSGVTALMLASQALLSPGDTVVAVVPLWPNLTAIAGVLGARVQTVALTIDAGGRWALDVDRLLAALPPGHADADGELARQPDRLGDAGRRDTRGPRPLTGWRLGWLVLPETLAPDVEKLVEFNSSCAPGFVQRAGLAAVRDGEPAAQAFQAYVREGAATLVSALARVPRVHPVTPDGAMYVLLRVDGEPDSLALARALVREARLGLAPGVAFGDGGEGFLRWCVARPEASLQDGVERLARFLATR
jgi:aspartate/methionine/tyrosine aminotransferase